MKIGQKLFYFAPLINFPEMCPMSFYLDIIFHKNRFKVFLFVFSPSLIIFFSAMKQSKKNSGLMYFVLYTTLHNYVDLLTVEKCFYLVLTVEDFVASLSE